MQVRDRIHADVCRQGFDAKLNAFVQSYGSEQLDASLLMIAYRGLSAGRRPAGGGHRRRDRAHAAAGRLRAALRHRHAAMDGLPPGEGAFLACSFWLADNYVLQGRIEEARALFTRLIGLCNDVGLLAEEFDHVRKRQVGNFPQAFSHLALIGTAHNLLDAAGPAHQRSAQTSAIR